MKETLRASEVSDNIYWVGAVDWNIRDFHGYSTNRGTTYYTYLDLENKNTLIYTVNGPFRHEKLARNSSIFYTGYYYKIKL